MKMKIKDMLLNYKNGKISLEKVISYISEYPYKKLKEATLDIHRELRRGIPEVVYCLHKTSKQLIEIINNLLNHHKFVVGTKLEKDKYQQIKNFIPKNHKYFEQARIITVGDIPKEKKGYVLVISAGTVDAPIVEEVATTCEILGNRVKKVYDVGVAGLHRINEVLPLLKKAKVVVVVAGMDGVLPSVVGGLAKVPVIAVPTSTGYGANFGGVAPLLTMLNSCAPGVVVVNINNGFGAGYTAHLINRK